MADRLNSGRAPVGPCLVANATAPRVRPLGVEEVDVRIMYFHDASDEHLLRLGVDRQRLPPVETWREWYRRDYARPIERRESYTLGWEVDCELIGFSSIDRIRFGHDAFLHLHIIRPEHRRIGFGRTFIRLSARHLFHAFRLERLFSEPNAFNRAPNRALQSAGFRYEFSHKTTPGAFNFPQPVTRWVLEADRVDLT